jgi:hypothetical protein
MPQASQKQVALQAAFDAIQIANTYGLTEQEKSFLCDWVFETAPCDTENDGTVEPAHSYTAAKPKRGGLVM